MEPWREKAADVFPELWSVWENADSPYGLWLELRLAFEKAYDKTPPDESLIARIYRYADWCDGQPRGLSAEDDLLTIVAVSFYEHIPQHPRARQDMPRWWQPEDLVDDGPDRKPRSIFRYNLTAEEFEELKRFLDREKDRCDPNLW
jgi:hypothetical protein